MSRSLKLIPVGNATGLILPEDMLAHLGVAEGDSIQIVESPTGTYLRAYRPELERQSAVAREVATRRRKALRELGK
jgi:putative addiction module antidote